ncbi:MAG: hypothetical protein U5K37_13130 [Natrialbaceae archaeon]|nr:hypothetical protein [Natrialbaceae archaeon]
MPGPSNATLESLFPNGTAGVTAIFAYEDGNWRLVTDLQRRIEPLEAFAMSTDSGGPSTVPITVRMSRETPAQTLQLDEGWTFVAGRLAGTPLESVGSTPDLITRPFGTPSGPDTYPDGPFEHHVVGSGEWGAATPVLDPFGGYFVHTDRAASITSAVANATNTSEATAQLGMAKLDGQVVTTPVVADPTGIELIVEAGDRVVTERALEADGSYSLMGLSDRSYDLTVSAPGFGPNANGTTETVTLSSAHHTRNFTVDWLEETNLYVDGGTVGLPGGDGGLPDMDLPGCTQQPNGTWEPDPVDINDTNQSFDISFEPANECYRIENVSINATTGALGMDAQNEHDVPNDRDLHRRARCDRLRRFTRVRGRVPDR